MGVVYARDVKERTLTFAVSGVLWETNLVMIDEETESLWSQVLGTAMKGPLAGEQLESVPSLITDWESWRTKYPDSSVALMSRTSNYNRSGHNLREQLSINITLNGESRFWPLGSLTHGVANEAVGGHPLVVAYHDPSLTAAIYDRRVDGQELTFELLSETPGSFQDDETGSVWDLCTGKAVSGSLEGKQLARLPSVISDLIPYSTFHPGGQLGTRHDKPPAD